jgi:hypothetical protein
MIEFINRLIGCLACLVFLPFIILKLPYQVRQTVLNATLNSKKALLPTTGLPMENSIVYPAVNPNTGSSFQQQPMKRFTLASETHMLDDKPLYKHF